jgi:hypothetical protein
MLRVKIRGSIGSWFATVQGKSLPIMWGDQMTMVDGGLYLKTDWLENAREQTAIKRKQFVDYFEPKVGGIAEIVVATAKDPKSRPRQILEYVAVYEVDVIKATPEIELKIRSKIVEAR